MTLPDVWHSMGPRGLMWWQWLALPLLVVGAWAAGRVVGAVLRGVLLRVARRFEGGSKGRDAAWWALAW